MRYAVQMSGIQKKYETQNVLNNIDLSLECGKIYGLLGINGAGKSTLMRIVAGMTGFDSGKLLLFENEDLSFERKKIGMTIEMPVLFDELSAIDNLKMFNTLCDCDEKELEELLNIVQLENTKKIVKKYSMGMKQKLMLAIALLGSPEFIMLDEPTNGLDPLAVREFRKLIERLNENEKVTFLISSHNVNEIIKIADVLIVLQKGTIVRKIEKEQLSVLAQNEGISKEDYLINLLEVYHE